uniref:Uncharacterized protein n=2 Tax=Aegilops tauschii subsp. strangulata TaxID=200361 RepID=A0A453A554_AEGTS
MCNTKSFELGIILPLLERITRSLFRVHPYNEILFAVESEHIVTLNCHFMLVLACIYIAHKLSFCRYRSPNIAIAVASIGALGLQLWHMMTRQIISSSCNGLYAPPCIAQPEHRSPRVDWVEAGAVSRAVRHQKSVFLNCTSTPGSPSMGPDLTRTS